MSLGNRLSQQRKKYCYTQAQLAKVLKLSQQVISNYERDVTAPTIEFLKEIADLYKISIDELVGHRVLFYGNDSLEKQILNIVEKLDDREKELSLGLVSQVAQHRGCKNDK